MIAFFKSVLQSILDEDEQSASGQGSAGDSDRRAAYRFRLGGFEIGVRGGHAVSRMQLKDLSCTGGAGITDLAVPVGGTIILHLSDSEARAAQIRWVRNTTMGFHFVRPLETELVLQIYGRRWCSFPPLWIDPSQPGEAPSAANAA